MRCYQKKRLFTHPIELIPSKGVPVQEVIMEGQQKKEEAFDIELPVLTKHWKKSSKLERAKNDVGFVGKLATSRKNAHISGTFIAIC